jgi:O-antigen/teichoic acid export membrane protein
MCSELVEVAGQSVRGSFLLFLGDALSTVVLAVGSILLARFLGPEYYGIYSITLAVPAILISLIGLGLDSAVIRFSARFRSENRAELLLSLIRGVTAFRLAISLIVWLLCFLYSDFLASTLLNRPEAGFYIRVSSFLIIFQTLFNLLYSLYVGLDRYDIGAAVKVFMSIVKSTSAPLLVVLGLGVFGAVLGHVLGFTVSAVLGISLLYLGPYRALRSVMRDGVESGGSFARDLKTMISYGLPLYVSSLILLLADQYRLLLLAYNVSDAEIGNFQAAGNFASLLVVISTPISTALFPAFSKLDPAGEDVRKAFQYSVKYTGMLIVPAAVFTILMSRSLVEIVYGDRYLLAPVFLSLYSAVYLYSAFGSIVLDNFFNGVGATRINLKATLIYVASFLPLSIILTSLLRVEGLILSILTSSILKVMYGVYIAKKELGASISFKSSVKIFVASGVAAALILPLILIPEIPNYVRLLLGGIIYLAVYVTVLPIIRGLEEVDIEVLGKSFRNYDRLRPLIDLIMKYESILMRKTQHAEE